MEDKEYLEHLKEGVDIELKEARERLPSSFFETYSSFANTQGGTIYLGIKEGKPRNLIVGVNDPEAMKKDIFTTVHNHQKVSVDLLSEEDVEIIDVEGSRILRVRVKEAPSRSKPVYLNDSLNRAYKRRGDADLSMDMNDLSYYISEQAQSKKDQLPNGLGIGIASLDKASLKAYREELSSVRGNALDGLDDEAFLKRIGALVQTKDGFSLTNGAILFFGRIADIHRIYPNYFLDYQLYEGTSNERWSRRVTSDDLDKPGDIYDFFCRLRKLIRENLPNPFFREGWTNLDGQDVYKAVLEAVANSLCNASYELQTGVVVKQRISSISIRNPGRMIVPSSQAKLGGISKPRNEAIMTFFRLIEVVEKAGTGIPRIYEVAKRYGYVEPIIRENAEFPYTEMEISFRPLPSDTPSRGLKEKTLSYLGEHGESSVKEIQEALSISKSQAASIVKDLLAMGLIKTNGFQRKGRKVSLK